MGATSSTLVAVHIILPVAHTPANFRKFQASFQQLQRKTSFSSPFSQQRVEVLIWRRGHKARGNLNF